MEVFVLHCSSAGQVAIQRPGHPCTPVSRNILDQSAVMAELLSSVEAGADSVTSLAPEGLLATFLDLVVRIGHQDLRCIDLRFMDTEALIRALKVG